MSQDRLSQLLDPLKQLPSEEAAEALDEDSQNPNVMLTSQLLSFDQHGLPTWFHPSLPVPQRRRDLLSLMDETLPAGYLPSSSQPSTLRPIVSTLRLIASELTS
jgi:hypothetical protein